MPFCAQYLANLCAWKFGHHTDRLEEISLVKATMSCFERFSSYPLMLIESSKINFELQIRGSYRGILVMCDYLILFSVKHEFRKLFLVIRDLKVFRDPVRTCIINRHSGFYHSILRDFETQVLRMVRIVYRE